MTNNNQQSGQPGKIFCIGYNKTGTSSLGRSLQMLGFKHSSFKEKIWRLHHAKAINEILDYADQYESFDDLPWLLEDMIPILDKTYPNSKFIYLTRDEVSWSKSIYMWTYKKTGGFPNLIWLIRRFREHREFVYEYFKDRPADQFIILDIKDKKGLKKLANFVGKDTDEEAFPHINKTDDLPEYTQNIKR